MNNRKWFWQVASLLVVVLLITNPELISFALLVDAIGLDMFLLLLEVQVVAVVGYYYRAWLFPFLSPAYLYLQRLDPYFFIPSSDILAKYPSVLCHAIPGYMRVYLRYVERKTRVRKCFGKPTV